MSRRGVYTARRVQHLALAVFNVSEGVCNVAVANAVGVVSAAVKTRDVSVYTVAIVSAWRRHVGRLALQFSNCLCNWF